MCSWYTRIMCVPVWIPAQWELRYLGMWLWWWRSWWFLWRVLQFYLQPEPELGRTTHPPVHRYKRMLRGSTSGLQLFFFYFLFTLISSFSTFSRDWWDRYHILIDPWSRLRWVKLIFSPPSLSFFGSRSPTAPPCGPSLLLTPWCHLSEHKERKSPPHGLQTPAGWYDSHLPVRKHQNESWQNFMSKTNIASTHFPTIFLHYKWTRFNKTKTACV